MLDKKAEFERESPKNTDAVHDNSDRYMVGFNGCVSAQDRVPDNFAVNYALWLVSNKRHGN